MTLIRTTLPFHDATMNQLCWLLALVALCDVGTAGAFQPPGVVESKLGGFRITRLLDVRKVDGVSIDEPFPNGAEVAVNGKSFIDDTPPADDDDDDDATNDATAAATNGASALSVAPSTPSMPVIKRKMDLMWCTPDYCKDSSREKVIGTHNQIVLNSPATGQVAYSWDKKIRTNVPSPQDQANDPCENIPPTSPSVLLLVKRNDDELVKVSAEAVRQLTDGDVEVLLAPDLSAKIKHHHGVDNEKMHLFEPPEISNMGQPLPENYHLDSEEWMDDTCLVDEEVARFPDLICTLGGDGLLLHASMMFQGAVPPIISIAGGSLGFLTPFTKDEMVDAIRIALGVIPANGENPIPPASASPNVYPPNMDSYPYEPLIQAPHRLSDSPNFKFGWGEAICLSIRMRLDCKVVSQDGIVRARFNVLNEVAIDRGSSPYLAALECFCDNVHLTTVQADGIIFATPTGSTAYSMAAGGSVVHPAVPCILVTPICPHVLSFRSMVFPDHVLLRCYVPEDARTHASVAFDGKNRQQLERGDSVQIQMSRYPVPTINKGDHSSDWLESLKRSFNFNTRPRQRPL
mmetsp:Transcript_12072/g.34942  ORF Transcript_12072/g.34942 Transcript_12072/m.34942 type:complete len:574 (+) Transcript_12072:910-2631(+)